MRKLFWILLILAVVVGGIVGLVYYGYGSVAVESSGSSTLVLEYNGDIDSIRELLMPESVSIETTVDVHNNSFVPLYIPALEHNLSLQGKPLCGPVYTQSIWLGPWGSKAVPVSTSVPGNELPRILLQYIQEYFSSGEGVSITVQSTARVAGFTISRTQSVPFELVSPVISLRLN